MAADADTPSTPAVPAPAPLSRPASTASPIAVVWCRQVDNEAESPGYTTVPEDFPGQRETLEVIRAVGHLTVNIADTHDYWDPDPSQPLSYYPNLFLYPAYNGRYTCLGRMFLSTEDRPRLGMKTLVLDTAQLLASGEFGSTILRWHASMGGPRRDALRSPPIPNPALYNLVGEGFLFHRGSTDPVVVVAADEWEPAMQAVLELVRTLPASLVSLGAILAFPYFLPQPKTNLHEFAEQLPLALAIMRVSRSESSGDRHAKRMASWESAPVTFRDLTEGIPATPKGRENVPLVLQYARDHQDAKLQPISQRVDLVEGPRLRAHVADPERQGGRDRRKEMWRIGTAMESAALLLQRARGRHVPVNVETAKRAQEYLQARIPEPDLAAPASDPEEPVISSGSGSSSSGQVPPWLAKPADRRPAVPAPSATTEVVPVSVSDDPSLLRAPVPASLRPPAPPAPAAATPSPAPAPAPTPAPVTSENPAPTPARATALPPPTTGPPPAIPFPVARPVTPAQPSELLSPSTARSPAAAPRPISSPTDPPRAALPPPFDPAVLRQQIQQDVARMLDARLAGLPRPEPGPAHALDDQLRAELDGRTEARVQFVQQQSAAQLADALAAVENRQAQLRGAELAQFESRIRSAVRDETAVAIERRLAETVDPKLEEVGRRLDESGARAAAAQLATTGQVNAAVAAAEQRLAGASALRVTPEQLSAAISSSEQRLGSTQADLIQAAEQRLAAASATRITSEQLTAAIAASEGRVAVGRAVEIRALEQRLTASAAALVTSEQLAAAMAASEGRLGAGQSQQIQALEQRLTASVGPQIDRSVRESLDPRIAELTRRIDEAARSAATSAQEQTRVELAKSVEALSARVASAEDQLRASLLAQLDLQVREAEEREAQARLGLDARLEAALQAESAAAGARQDQRLHELEQHLNLLIDGRLRESDERSGVSNAALEERISTTIEEKLAAAEESLAARLDGQSTEANEARVHAMADLQVRLQAYFDQRVREEQERERQKYIELLARMKGEVDSSLARMVDSARFDTALREKLTRTLEVYRAETQRSIESRIATAEQQLKVDQTDVTAHLSRLEQLLEDRRAEADKSEEALRAEIEELDRRSQILADRLVPVVRKTWLRVVEIQKGAGAPENDVQFNQLRREFTRELQRIEGEAMERTTEIRDRMESAISNQGRVWLTLIRQLSQLSDDRRTVERRHGVPAPPDLEGTDAEIAASLEGIPGVFPTAGGLDEDPVNPLDPDPEEPTRTPSSGGSPTGDAGTRRRFRRAPR